MLQELFEEQLGRIETGFHAGYAKPEVPANNVAMAYHYLWVECCISLIELAGQRAGALDSGADHPGNRGARFRLGDDRDNRDRHRERDHRADSALLALPLTILTLGLFRLVINAFLLKLASLFTPGFAYGIPPAVLGALVLTILEGLILRHWCY